MNRTKRIISWLMLLVLLTGSIPAAASSRYDLVGHWSDMETSIGTQSLFMVNAWDPVWTLRSTQTYSFTQGTITLKSYTMELLDGSKLCKGTTTHSTSFRGYVRARFENLFREVDPGSDSGRVYSYKGATAETPVGPYVGYVTIAHTYCGVD